MRFNDTLVNYYYTLSIIELITVSHLYQVLLSKRNLKIEEGVGILTRY